MTDTPKRPASRGPRKSSSSNKTPSKSSDKPASSYQAYKTRNDARNAKPTGFKSRSRPNFSGGAGKGGFSKGGPDKGARDFNERDAEHAVSRLAPPSQTRLFAARAVQLVLRDKVTLEAAFEMQMGYNDLDGRDRAFARLIAATTFRRWGQISAVLKPMLKSKPPVFVMAVLETAVAQILFLDTGPHAAVSEAVNVLKASGSTRGFSGLTNAVLRRVAGEGKALAGATAPSGNFPRWLTNSWEKAYGRVTVRKIALQLIKDPPLDLSVKSDPLGWADKLGGIVLPTGSVRLPKIGDVTALEGFGDGEWWAQDIAASLPVKVLAEGFGSKEGDLSGKRVLDMCAAPGGKTMQLANLGAQVTAIDISEKRLGRLHENLARTKLEAQVIAADGRHWKKAKDEAAQDVESQDVEGQDAESQDAEIMGVESEAQFDAVLLDAPCSATGTFRRHPDVLFNKAHTDIGKLASLQDKLMLAMADHVAPGGQLIYCVCSLQPDEGAPRIKHFLKNRTDFRLNPVLEDSSLQGLGVVTPEGFVRSLPHYLGTEGGMDGFFIARLVRDL